MYLLDNIQENASQHNITYKPQLEPLIRLRNGIQVTIKLFLPRQIQSLSYMPLEDTSLPGGIITRYTSS